MFPNLGCESGEQNLFSTVRAEIKDNNRCHRTTIMYVWLLYLGSEPRFAEHEHGVLRQFLVFT